MKIALLGYGKMGKEIEKLALKRHHEIFLKIDNEAEWRNNLEKLSESDVAIDFSMPDCVTDNIKRCFQKNVPIVVGTTAWFDELDEIKELCIQTDQAMIYASNFSIGVNIIFEINRKLARIMNGQNKYELTIDETHHIHKIDAPSGTAIKLANDAIDILDRKNAWSGTASLDTGMISITSNREGNITGTHLIKYESDIDSLEIKHEAKNRQGFALGAVLAAEWIVGKNGFFEMKDMLGF